MNAPKPSTRIVHRGRGHSYLLDGEKVPGVTTILGDGLAKPALVNWAAKITADHAINHWAELDGLPVAERLRRLERARWDDLTGAGERGRDVHLLVQRYVAGEAVTPPDELADHFNHGCDFVDAWVAETVAVECAVFSREFRYGGRFDLLADLADGHRWLLDFKTSRSGVFPETALQLAAYRYADFYVLEGDVDDQGAAVEHPMPRVERTGVVHVRADGYDLYPLDGGPEAFELFGHCQRLAEFAGDPREQWIGDALRPPELEVDAA